MKIEHFALNVADPVGIARWYVAHLGLKVVRQMTEAPYTRFLADSSGDIMLEIYNNPSGQVPSYALMDPLLVHLAFVSENPGEDMQKLQGAGAHLVEEQHLKDGSHLVMMRDPWGLAIQLCKRGTPMLSSAR